MNFGTLITFTISILENIEDKEDTEDSSSDSEVDENEKDANQQHPVFICLFFG